MKGSRTATKADRAREIIRKIEANLEDAIAIEAMLSWSNDDPAVWRAYDQTPAVFGCNLIRHNLLIQLALVMMRIHDPGAGNKAALPHLFKLLRDRDVRAEIRRDARAWHPDELDLADNSEQTAVEAISDAQTRWEVVKEQEPNKRLRRHRSRYIAHSLIEMSDEEKAVCNDAYKLLEDTTPIVEKLLLGLLGRSEGFADRRETRRKHAEAFWSRATAGVETSRGR